MNGFCGEACEIKELWKKTFLFLVLSGYNGYCKANHLQILLQMALLSNFYDSLWWTRWKEREWWSRLLRRIWFVFHSRQVSQFYSSIWKIFIFIFFLAWTGISYTDTEEVFFRFWFCRSHRVPKGPAKLLTTLSLLLLC